MNLEVNKQTKRQHIQHVMNNNCLYLNKESTIFKNIAFLDIQFVENPWP